MRADTDPLNATNFHTENLFGLFVTQDVEPIPTTVPYRDAGRPRPSRPRLLPPAQARNGRAQDRLQSLCDEDPDARRFARRGGARGADLRARDQDRPGARRHRHQPGRAQGEQSLEARRLRQPRRPGSTGSRLLEARRASRQPAGFHRLAAGGGDQALRLVASEPLDVWKDWLAFHTINQVANVLPKAYDDAQFAFYGHTHRQPQQRRATSARSPRSTPGSATRSASSTPTNISQPRPRPRSRGW
jgi:putative endopeptidase